MTWLLSIFRKAWTNWWHPEGRTLLFAASLLTCSPAIPSLSVCSVNYPLWYKNKAKTKIFTGLLPATSWPAHSPFTYFLKCLYLKGSLVRTLTLGSHYFFLEHLFRCCSFVSWHLLQSTYGQCLPKVSMLVVWLYCCGLWKVIRPLGLWAQRRLWDSGLPFLFCASANVSSVALPHGFVIMCCPYQNPRAMMPP